jgi:hypothetical protein
VPYIISYSGNLFTLRFLSRALLFRESFYSSPFFAATSSVTGTGDVTVTDTVTVTVTVTDTVTVAAAAAVTGTAPEPRRRTETETDTVIPAVTVTVTFVHGSRAEVKSTFFCAVNTNTPVVHHSPTNDFSASSA